MAPLKKETIEEIPVEDVEIVTKSRPDHIRHISAEEVYKNDAPQNPFQPFLGNIEEFKKIRFFSFLAFVLSMIGIKFYPLYFESCAIVLAILDLWKGSKFTRKLAIFTMIFASFILLSSWQ